MSGGGGGGARADGGGDLDLSHDDVGREGRGRSNEAAEEAALANGAGAPGGAPPRTADVSAVGFCVVLVEF